MRNRGFTIVELIIVLSMAAILVSIAIRSFNGVADKLATNGARQTLLAMNARARIQAVEFGTTVYLNVDPVGDSVWITKGNEVLDRIDFNREFSVDLHTTGEVPFKVCMTPRGFASDRCNTYSYPMIIDFELSDEVSSVELFTLGKMRTL